MENVSFGNWFVSGIRIGSPPKPNTILSLQKVGMSRGSLPSIGVATHLYSKHIVSELGVLRRIAAAASALKWQLTLPTTNVFSQNSVMPIDTER